MAASLSRNLNFWQFLQRYRTTFSSKPDLQKTSFMYRNVLGLLVVGLLLFFATLLFHYNLLLQSKARSQLHYMEMQQELDVREQEIQHSLIVQKEVKYQCEMK